MPKALGAAGALGRLRLDVSGGVLMFTPLVFGHAVGARALARLQVAGVDADTCTGRHAPDVGSYAGYLLEVLLSESDAALEAGGWVRYSGGGHKVYSLWSGPSGA